MLHFKGASEGKATTRTKLASGFGVHVAYGGHDMHGTKIGPDGRLYWTIADTGAHVCLRAPSTQAVDAFHAAALAAGGASDGAPGLREHRTGGYYAAFAKDLDGNRIEAVTFVQADR